MNGSNLSKSSVACAVGAALSLSGFLAAGEPGKMTREVWNNIPGAQLSAFTGGSRYWQAADAVATFAGATAPSNTGDNFAARIRGYVTAPATGNYTFWIASDDDSELYLSPGDSKFDRVKIASLAGSVSPRAWDVKTSQKSVAIPLVAGQRYFIESLHKEGAGADHLAIAWSCNAPGLPNGYLPVGTATAAVVATGTSLASVTNAGGAISGAWINILPVASTYYFANDGTTASFQLQFYDGTYTKVVKVTLAQSGADIVASQVYAKYKTGNLVGQDFDIIASPGTAPLGSGGYGVDAVSLSGQNGVLASTRELIPAAALESFTVDPNDLDNDELRDDWETAHGFSTTDNGTANPAQHPLADPDHDGYPNFEESEYGTDPNTRGGVPGSLLLETWNNLGGSRIEDLIYQERFCGAPDTSEFVFSAETPVNRADNYGARMRGYVIAPATGNYTFYVAGDDSCQLWFSSSESQFARQKVASVDGWTNVRQWTKYASQKSAVIALQAGQKIYLEALMKEAGGGDHVEIGWTTPGTTAITVIPGSALESYAYDANDADGDNMQDNWETLHGLDPVINDAALDPDQDGIPNYLEAANNTDPHTKNTIAGALQQELWLNVPGYHVAELTSSPKFLQEPDFRSLVTSAQTVSQPYDAFGSRLRGYLTAPSTGTYTFWVLGDDETELWLSSSDSKFDKQLLARPTLNTSGFDTDISQKSRAVSLVAGQNYYIEILHKDYYGGDFCQIAWTKPGAAREIIPGTALGTFIPVSNDQDDDDLPDDWEIANGLDPHDNGRINPANGSQGDLDGDGLSNAEELKAGTRADLADTDGDGMNDRDEVEMLETSALTADAAPFQSIATIPGASFTAASGSWVKEDGKARQDCVRGWLEYPITLSADGVYQLDLAFTPVTGASASPEYEIVFSADGNTIQRETVTVAEASSGHAKILTPWLGAGSHTLRVFLDNSYWFRRVTIDRLEVLAARGPDANGNGTPDWVDARLARTNSLEAPSESLTSPACLEGKAKWSALTTVTGSSVQTAANDRWFANVPLDDTQATTVTVALENGALPVTRQITWIPTNLLANPAFTIRQGDSLKLSAFTGPSGTPEESVSITVEGESATFSADQSLVHAFHTAGSIPVQITHTLDGNVTTSSATIQVIAAPVIESPVCVVGFHRPVDIPALPNGVTLQLDDRIEIRETTTDASGAKYHTLRLNTLDDRTAVLRLGGLTGPIMGTLPFRAMRVRSGLNTALYYAGMLGSNQWDIVMPVMVDGNSEGTSITYDINIGGVTFDDGLLSRTLLPASHMEFQWAEELHFHKVGTAGSNCYRTSIRQGNVRIANTEKNESEKPTIDLQIADGQGGALLLENEEESPGAFTVANKNDTDGDGKIDKENDVDIKGEVDLMQLVVNPPVPADDPEATVTLEKPANAKLFKLTADKKGGEETNSSWKVKDLPQTFWVELQEPSATVRAEVFTLSYGDAEPDTVKATAVWATLEQVYNTGNSPPSDLDDPTVRTDAAQGLGPVLHNGPGNGWSGAWGVSGGILLEFKIEPAGLENEAKVKIDLTRRKETFKGVLITGSQQWTTLSSSFPTSVDVPNDDNPAIYDEDVIPKNKHIYSIDNPSSLLAPIPSDGSHNFYRGNFFEHVRVAVGANASRPNAHIDANGKTQNPSNAGSRASAKEPWLTRLWAVTSNGAFVFNTGVDTNGNSIRNFIAKGNHEVLSKP